MKSTLLCLFCLISFHGHTGEARSTARVQVTVAGDTTIARDVESFVKRELRSLTDVVVTEIDPDHTLELVAVKNSLTDGRIAGYFISTLASRPFNPSVLSLMTTNTSFAESYCTNFVMIDGHWLQAGGDLRTLCSRIVTQFDSEILEGDRKLTQMTSRMVQAVKEQRDRKAHAASNAP